MRDLINKMLSREDIDVTRDWKIVTIWIGSNDLCKYCDDREMYSADNYENHIRQALLMLKSGLCCLFSVQAVQFDDRH
jgi:phospholipase B1